MALTKVQKEGIENLINNNADNRVITGSGTANTLNGESNLTFALSGSDPILTVQGTSAGHAQLNLKTGGTTDHCSINFGDSDDGDIGEIRYTHSSDAMQFDTNNTERMRITGDGPHLLLGGTSDVNEITETSANAGMVIGGTGFGNAGLAIITSTSGTGRLYFGDNTGNNAGRNRGQINYGHSDDHMRFATAGSERMRIDSSGRMFLGLSSTSFPKKLNIQGSSGAIIALKNNDTTSYAANTNTSIEFGLNTGNTGNQNGSCEIRAFKENGTNGNNARGLSFYTGSNGGSPTERMRIDSSGDLFVGCSSHPSSSVTGFSIHNGGGGHHFVRTATGSSNLAFHYQFINTNGAVGQIATSGTSTAYQTSSDYRLKENAVAISDGITRLKTLKPYRFNFKADPTTTVDGFFAHEVTAVPEAISGTKDEVDENNKPVYQGIDQSKLVPLLVAAVQELITKVETLEAA